MTQQLGPGWGACQYVHVHQLLLRRLQNRGDVQLRFTCTNSLGLLDCSIVAFMLMHVLSLCNVKASFSNDSPTLLWLAVFS